MRAFSTSFSVGLNHLFSLEGFGPLPRIGKHHPCTKRELVPDRLDAAFYSPEHLRLQHALTSVSAIPLGTHCQLVTDRWQKSEAEFLYYEIGTLDVTTGRTSPVKTKASDAASRAQRLLRPWDVLVSTVRPNRKNVGLVTHETISDLPLVASTGFAVIRFENKETAAFFHAWLRSDVATQQLVQWNAGGSYPAIEEDVVPRILCPVFNEGTIREVGTKCLVCMQAGDLSIALCDSAKLLVEALIELNVTEDEIVHAQTLLEQGDDSADRAILSRVFAVAWMQHRRRRCSLIWTLTMRL